MLITQKNRAIFPVLLPPHSGEEKDMSGRTFCRASELALGLAIIAQGCATTSAAPPYKLYPGPERPREELAVVLAEPRLYSIEINGLKVHPEDWSEVQMAPGTHLIAFRVFRCGWIRCSPCSSFSAQRATLLPGSVYRFRWKNCTAHLEDLQSRVVATWKEE